VGVDDKDHSVLKPGWQNEPLSIRRAETARLMPEGNKNFTHQGEREKKLLKVWVDNLKKKPRARVIKPAHDPTVSQTKGDGCGTIFMHRRIKISIKLI